MAGRDRAGPSAPPRSGRVVGLLRQQHLDQAELGRPPGPDQLLLARRHARQISAGLSKDRSRIGVVAAYGDHRLGAGDQALGKIFTIGYILAGIGIFVPAATSVAQATLRGEQKPRE